MPTPGASDAELILAVQQEGDARAFAELVRRHQSRVRALLRRLARGDAMLADDLAQETFVLAWRHLGRFRFEARFSTWLFTIANNLAFSLSTTFLLLYYTDVVGLPAAAIGTMFLIVRLWDAFADLFAGRQDPRRMLLRRRLRPSGGIARGAVMRRHP